MNDPVIAPVTWLAMYIKEIFQGNLYVLLKALNMATAGL